MVQIDISFVFMNDISSSLIEISCGVSLGSILGPHLFSIHINDFDRSFDIFSLILFADDSNLFYAHPDYVALFRAVNSELENPSMD